MTTIALNNTSNVDKGRELLLKLKVPAMADCFARIATDPTYQHLTLEEAVISMAERELENRAEKRQARFLQRSNLRELGVWNQVDVSKAIYTAERNFKEQDLRRLLTCEWIAHARNILMEGPTGTGKTWLLALLGKQACLRGYQTQYYRYARLLELLGDARAHRETATLRRNLNRNRLLIIDDFGTSSITDDLASDLLTVLEEREETSSIAIAAQLPFNEWHRYLGGSRNADAIMDRLLNSSYQFELRGASMRERNSVESI